MGVGGPGKFLDVQHGEGRVGDGLAEHRPGLRPEGGVQFLLGAVRVHKGEVNAHPLHGDGKQVVSTTIDGRRTHHMFPAGNDVEDGIEGRRLAGGGEHGRRPALQGADLGRHMIVGWILQAGIKIAAGLQVKEGSHLLPRGIPEGGGLNDGDIAGLSVPRRISGMNALGTDMALAHGLILPFFAGIRAGRLCIAVVF